MIDDARAAIRALISPLPPRLAVLADAIGAALAEPLYTTTAFPPTDVAAMDGYAVHGLGPWLLRSGEQIAGTSRVDALRPGEAVRIGTGAQLPDGATAVLRDEYVAIATVAGSPGVRHRVGSPDCDDTRRRGESWPVGTELAPTGQRVGPAMVSAAAAAETPVMSVRGAPAPTSCSPATRSTSVARWPGGRPATA